MIMDVATRLKKGKVKESIERVLLGHQFDPFDKYSYFLLLCLNLSLTLNQ
jgi:hypothetical protein